jgi:DNA-binding NtrC family response regulator
MTHDISIIIIEDQLRYQEDALVWELKDRFENVYFFTDSKDALEFITTKASLRIIVLLDIDFNRKAEGHQILKDIRKFSYQIPVILWSGIDEQKETFSDFINNKAFGYLNKHATIEEAFKIIDDAVIFLNESIDKVIEEWITQNHQTDKDKPVFLSSENKSYSLNDILREIRQDTEIGKDFSKRLTKLTIDLLMRNKESIND